MGRLRETDVIVPCAQAIDGQWAVRAPGLRSRRERCERECWGISPDTAGLVLPGLIPTSCDAAE